MVAAGSGGGSVTRAENGRGDELAIESFNNHIFGQVPSRFEVKNAISALQDFMVGICSSGSTSNWFHQMFGNDGAKILQSRGFRMRIVVSLASDQAVWDAVLKNKVVRKFREALSTAEGERLRSYDNEQDLATHFMSWIVDIIKAKVMDLIESFIELVNEIFQSPGKVKNLAEVNDQVEENVRSSFLLCIVTLLIVVVTRAQMV